MQFTPKCSFSLYGKPWQLLHRQPLDKDQRLNSECAVCVLWTGVWSWMTYVVLGANSNVQSHNLLSPADKGSIPTPSEPLGECSQGMIRVRFQPHWNMPGNPQSSMGSPCRRLWNDDNVIVQIWWHSKTGFWATVVKAALLSSSLTIPGQTRTLGLHWTPFSPEKIDYCMCIMALYPVYSTKFAKIDADETNLTFLRGE